MPGEPEQSADDEPDPGLDPVQGREHEPAVPKLLPETGDEARQDIENGQPADDEHPKHHPGCKPRRQRVVDVLPCGRELLRQSIQKNLPREIPADSAKQGVERIRNHSYAQGNDPILEVIPDATETKVGIFEVWSVEEQTSDHGGNRRGHHITLRHVSSLFSQHPCADDKSSTQYDQDDKIGNQRCVFHVKTLSCL